MRSRDVEHDHSHMAAWQVASSSHPRPGHSASGRADLANGDCRRQQLRRCQCRNHRRDRARSRCRTVAGQSRRRRSPCRPRRPRSHPRQLASGGCSMSSASIDKALWYLGRSSGVVSLVLLTLVVALGIATRSGRLLPGLPRFAVSAVHRSASLLAVVFLTVHVVTLTLDPQSQLRWLDAVLPFGSHFKPLWVGLGAASLDLMAALVVTSLLRQRIGHRLWRAIHWAAYALWPMAILHTIGTGTDMRSLWMVGLVVSCSIMGVGWIGWRLSTRFLDATDRATVTQLPSRETRLLTSSKGLR